MTEIRFDRVDISNVQITTKESGEGYYKGNAIATRAGIFEYRNKDGSPRFELRPEEEVFKPQSMKTMSGVPITIDHPKNLVNSKNISFLGKGHFGENQIRDGLNLLSSFAVTHHDAVDQVRTKKRRQLSMGYKLKLIEKPGVWIDPTTGKSHRYDAIQTGIEYNHCALVENGRAGNAEIRADSADDEQYSIRVDGVDALIEYREDENSTYNIEEESLMAKDKDNIAQDIEKIKEKEAAIVSSKDAEIKDLKERLARVESIIANDKPAEKTTIKKDSVDAINLDAAVNEKIETLRAAEKVINLDDLKGKSSREIHEAVIKAKSIKLDFADKSDDYVKARFDAIIEKAPNANAITNQMQKAASVRVNNDAVEVKSARDIIASHFKR